MSDNYDQDNQGTQGETPQSDPPQPGGQQPLNPYGAPSEQGQPPQPWGQQPNQYGAPQQPGQPQQPWGQQPGQPQQPWGQQPNQYGAPQQPGQPQQPWGQQPSPYGAPYGEVPKKKQSLAWLWILLGVLVVLVIAGVFVWKLLFSAPSIEDLYVGCANGSASDCEDLFQKANEGSADEQFGRTCGGRTDGTIECELADMSTQAGSWEEVDGGGPGAGDWSDSGDGDTDAGGDWTTGGLTPLEFDDPNGCMDIGCEPGMLYGDNARLDNLFSECDAGNMRACDELYMLSEGGSEYEEFAYPCGDLSVPGDGAWCAPESVDRWS